MLKQQSIRKSIGSLLFGQVANYLIILVQIPYLTRHISPEGFGVYSFANTLMLVGLYATYYAANNSAIFLFRKHSKSPVKRSIVFWNQISVQIPISIILSIVMAAWVCSSAELQKDWQVYVILIANFLLTSIYCPWSLAALEKFRAISIVITTTRLATLVLMVLLVKEPKDVAWAFAAVVMPNMVVSIGFYVWIIRTGIVKPLPVRRWKPTMVLRRDFFIAATVYASIAFSYVGIILAKFLIDADQYGHLAFADRFRWIAQVIIPSFGAVLFSRYCGERAISAERGARFGQKSALALGAFGLAAGLGLALLAKPAVLILGGREFLSSLTSTLIVATTIPLIAINYYLTYFVVNVFDLAKQQLAIFAFTTILIVAALLLHRPSTPEYIMSIISGGEVLRALMTWLIVRSAGMNAFHPGFKRGPIRTEA